MGIDEQFRIDGVGGADQVQPGNPTAPSDPTEFRRLLETLEGVARKSSQHEDVADVDKLQEEMRKADDDFAAVMDLRERLEEAFRKANP